VSLVVLAAVEMQKFFDRRHESQHL